MKLNDQILFKVHENDECTKLLSVVRYLYFCGIDVRPKMVIERNFPGYIKTVPTVVISNRCWTGLKEIVVLYERIFKIENLLEKSIKFSEERPNYRIGNSSNARIVMDL